LPPWRRAPPRRCPPPQRCAPHDALIHGTRRRQSELLDAADASPMARRPLSHCMLHRLPLRQDLEQGRVRIRRVSLSLFPPPPVERRRGSNGCPLSPLGAGGPCPAIQHPRRRGGGPARWRPSGVLGSVSPSRWWPVAGSDAMVASRRRAPPCVIFFFFLVLFLVRLNSGAQRRTFHAVSKGRHHLAFLCRAPPRGAWQRFLAVRFCGMRTANEFHRAKICRVPFVVRLDPSEFEKAQGVKSGTVGVLKPGTVVVSGGAPQLSANTTPNRSTC
jgi:uncharacterized membrane protein YtjA (UPF0391 family)